MSTSLLVGNLRVEQNRDGFGIASATPRISWSMAAAPAGWVQAAYMIERRMADGRLEASGRIDTHDSVLQPWPFAPLAAREQCEIRVQVWGNDGSVSPWSPPLALEASLLSPADWSAEWISPDWEEDINRPQPATLLRRTFAAAETPRQARLYITA
ncbi:MAG TPA: alpha-L-rhamnosidase, partial [Roseiflexaceae bacterium]|nr:alpha-L-rhamnosidase [Roseiflexaceae bacterium]